MEPRTHLESSSRQIFSSNLCLLNSEQYSRVGTFRQRRIMGLPACSSCDSSSPEGRLLLVSELFALSTSGRLSTSLLTLRHAKFCGGRHVQDASVDFVPSTLGRISGIAQGV